MTKKNDTEETVNSKSNVFSLKRREEDIFKLEFEDGTFIEFIDSRRWTGKDFIKYNKKNKEIQILLKDLGFSDSNENDKEYTEEEYEEQAVNLEKLLDSSLRLILPGITEPRLKEVGGIMEKTEVVMWFTDEYTKKKQRA